MTQWCARIVQERWFNTNTALVIILNACVLGIETYPGVVASYGSVLRTIDTVCFGYFILEVIIRAIACSRRPQDFFRDPWNVFDLVVLILALTPGIRENITLLRLVRLARVLRVVRVFPTMRIIVSAVWRSVPGTASLGVVGIVMLYLYGMLGWTLFAETMPEKFGSIGRSTLTLFYLMLLDDLSDTIQQGLALSRWTLLYFVSFVLLGGFLLVNILLGVVLSSLEEARESEAEEARSASAVPQSVTERLAALRSAIDELERDLHAQRADNLVVAHPSEPPSTASQISAS